MTLPHSTCPPLPSPPNHPCGTIPGPTGGEGGRPAAPWKRGDPEQGPGNGQRQFKRQNKRATPTGLRLWSYTVTLLPAASSGPPGFALHLVEDSGPRVPGKRIKDTGTTSQSDTAGECQTQSNSAGGLSRGRFWRIVF